MQELPLSLANDFVDQEILRSVYFFHTQAANRDRSLLEVYRKSFTALSKEQLSLFEYHSVSFGGRPKFLPLTYAEEKELRAPSAKKFVDKALEKEEISYLMTNSFYQRKDGGALRRPYPSGGALYSVQVIVYIRNCKEIETGAYHYRPSDNSLEFLTRVEQEEICDCMEFAESDLKEFQLLFLYAFMGTIPLVKYGYRGYRLALLEAGSMYQSLIVASEQIGLRSRVWSGFQDERLSVAMGVDPRACWPIICQVVGREG